MGNMVKEYFTEVRNMIKEIPWKYKLAIVILSVVYLPIYLIRFFQGKE